MFLKAKVYTIPKHLFYRDNIIKTPIITSSLIALLFSSQYTSREDSDLVPLTLLHLGEIGFHI